MTEPVMQTPPPAVVIELPVTDGVIDRAETSFDRMESRLDAIIAVLETLAATEQVL
jgi:hypothetical protein